MNIIGFLTLPLYFYTPEARLARKTLKDFDEEKDGDELFFYKDQDSRDSWESNGRTEQNAGCMVHVIPGEGQITLVHEGLDEAQVRKNFRLNMGFG